MTFKSNFCYINDIYDPFKQPVQHVLNNSLIWWYKLLPYFGTTFEGKGGDKEFSLCEKESVRNPRCQRSTTQTQIG